jgi:hypothetical protein
MCTRCIHPTHYSSVRCALTWSFVMFAIAVVIRALNSGQWLLHLPACTSCSHRTVPNRILNMLDLRFSGWWLWRVLISWDITCCPLKVNLCLGGTHHLQTNNQYSYLCLGPQYIYFYMLAKILLYGIMSKLWRMLTIELLLCLVCWTIFRLSFNCVSLSTYHNLQLNRLFF